MKILVVNNFFPPRRGGSSHLSHLLALEYLEGGHEVVVLTSLDTSLLGEIYPDNLDIVRLKSWNIPKLPGAFRFDIPFTISISNILKIRKLLNNFKPDIIHQHGQFLDLTWITGFYARFLNISTVLSIHTRLESTTSISSIILGQLDKLVVRPFLRFYKPNVVVMDDLMEKYIEKRYAGVYSSSARINVGISSDWFDLDRKHNSSNQGKIVSSVGHVIDLRNRISLVRSIALLVEKYPDLQVWIVGEIYSTRFIELARELGVLKNFNLLGNKSQDFIKELYCISSVEAHDIEGIGFGTSSIEALAVGIPVIASISGDHFFGEINVDEIGVTRINSDDHIQLASAIDEILSQEMISYKSDVTFNYFFIGNVALKHIEYFNRIISDK